MARRTPTPVFWDSEQIGTITGEWVMEMFNRSATWTASDESVAGHLEAAQEEEGDIYLRIGGETCRFGMIDGDEISVFHPQPVSR